MAIDTAAVAALSERPLGPEHKGLPPAAWGRTAAEFVATASELDHLVTPLLTIDQSAFDANLTTMADWTEAAGVALAPHGKTTMAPQLWARQLAAGAWGITLATPWQVQVARSFGVGRIMLANAITDPVGLHWLATELAADPNFEFVSWVDSVDTVSLMDRHLGRAPGTARVRVVVELGGPGGRTGARSVEAALAVADAVDGSARLELAGIGGYEGAFAHDRSSAGLDAVHRYLDEIVRLHTEVGSRMASKPGIVTAGGSAYPDVVVEHLAGLTDDRTTVVLRSGAYVIHDDGFYAGITPLPLRSAMHGWARVISRPEPGLALLDAGKRDLPFDEGLFVPQGITGTVSAMNDQHTFLRSADAPLGSVVRLGLSHPCTAFDKWRLIPVIDNADAEHPRVVDLIHTFF